MEELEPRLGWAGPGHMGDRSLPRNAIWIPDAIGRVCRWADHDLHSGSPTSSHCNPFPRLRAYWPKTWLQSTVTTDAEGMITRVTTLTMKAWGFWWQLRHLSSREPSMARLVLQCEPQGVLQRWTEEVCMCVCAHTRSATRGDMNLLLLPKIPHSSPSGDHTDF